jgi:hypothetical protein
VNSQPNLPVPVMPSRMIEAFPEPRRRCAAHDQSSERLINVDFIAEADF